jgi:hypothetical protein
MKSFVKSIVTDLDRLSRHVTDDVTDVLSKNFGKTVFVTMSRIKMGVPYLDLVLLDLPTPSAHCQFHFLALSKAF